eukprot:NODE_11_length_54881_cov_1.430718.p24 type:complete len:270 gc:universal NODE_11_length_54881_cov_1.430718:17713-18522(+)
MFVNVIYAQIAHNSNYKYEYARSHSLYAPYTELELSSKYWDFGQDTVVFTQLGVRLTPDFQSRRGWLWSKEKISGSFEVDLEYKIHGHGQGLSGDGMAFWFVEDKFENGEALGYKSNWNGISVMLDTYNNGRNDYFRPHAIMGLYNDKSKYYNKDADGKEMSMGHCSKNLRNNEKATRMRIVYIEKQKFQVFHNKESWADWELCFEVDMSSKTMPKEMFLGFTAETGGLTDNHDVVSINTNKITLNVIWNNLVWWKLVPRYNWLHFWKW